MSSTNSRRPLSELNLIDNFLFTSAIDHAEYGIPISEAILRPILQREVSVKHIAAEKVILPGSTSCHGIRLDALIEEDRTDVFPGEFFDLEPDQKVGEKKQLPKRARFYHSRINGKLLEAGRKYKELPDTWVIFILSFDPFGENRIIYTMRNRCMELPDLPYDDGATTLFLYIDGEKGDVPRELRELLRYIGNTRSEFAVNPELRRIHSYIEEIRTDSAIKEAYMLFTEYVERERREAAQEEKERADEAEAELKRSEAELKRSEAELKRSEAEIAELRALLKANHIALPE